MTTEDRIARLEAQLEKIQAKQSELHHQLAQAQRDQWQARIEDLEVQVRLGAREANEKANALMVDLRSRWAEARVQFDDAASTASSVGETMRSGLQSAVRDVRKALLESQEKISD